MKKALAVSAFALVMAFPLVGSASLISNQFLTSSTGNEQIYISDTIQFEVSITVDAQAVDTFLFSLTGDAGDAVGSSLGSGWANVDNMIVNWEWYYTAMAGDPLNQVKMNTNGRITPSPETFPPPARVAGQYGFGADPHVGLGTGSMVGTVTIHADTLGAFTGGGYNHPNVDGQFNLGVGGDIPFTPGNFTVVPEPGTALLMFLGLGGLGVMGRKSRK